LSALFQNSKKVKDADFVTENDQQHVRHTVSQKVLLTVKNGIVLRDKIQAWAHAGSDRKANQRFEEFHLCDWKLIQPTVRELYFFFLEILLSRPEETDDG
jgi:hypothetical protein